MGKKPLWVPSAERIEQSNLTRYVRFLKKERNLSFSAYGDLYRWSIQDIPTFWKSIWDFSEIQATPCKTVMQSKEMLGTKWFLGARLNFAENLLKYRDAQIALISLTEHRPAERLTYQELYLSVAQCASALKKMGVTQKDCVAGLMPNISETVIAMLATSSLGAIWSSCSPDFGVQGVIDRFGQIKPKVLFVPDGYDYHGKFFDLHSKISEIVRQLPSVQRVVIVPFASQGSKINLKTVPKSMGWDSFLDRTATDLEFEQLPFDHPLYIMYSSGTTGVPKCIVHGQGGTLLQHLKELMLHTNLKRQDRICYLTTCGWMMWNWLVSSLAVGATVVLTDGSSGYPDLSIRWKQIDREKITVFGTSPKFLSLCEKQNLKPREVADLSTLCTILSTGSPLSKEQFRWVYQSIKSDVQLSSICGGTDIISCFMLGCPWLPVYEEEIQCRGLGMAVEAYHEEGKSVVGEKGELVCRAPFPSMPVYFWNDKNYEKYKETYFDVYPNVWRHGDYIEITPNGGVIVYGRSDATLNPGGVRIGTAEIYRQIEAIPEIKDSIVVGQDWDQDVRIILFVVLKEGEILDESLKERIKQQIKFGASPRHVPAKILQVQDIPYTLSGKKVELAVRNIIHHEPVKNISALINPKALDEFKNRVELQD